MFRERSLRADGVMFDLFFLSPSAYRLQCLKRGKVLVAMDGKGYEFKSVEKLRYDFERNVEKALRQG